MRKAKLPTLAKKINACRNCGAAIIYSYDYDNKVYKYQCQGCGAKRYEPKVRFETRFIGADRL